MDIKIKTKSKLEKIAVITFLYSLGYSYDDIPIESVLVDEMDCYSDYPHVYVYGDDEYITFCDNSEFADVEYTWSKDYTTIIKKLSKSNTMQLTEDYNAVIVESGIEVGCQFISFEKFDELVDFVNNRR
jgi:hypothetical protein